MPGTGQGLLQPTKLVMQDDYIEALAPPGYVVHKTELDLSNGGANLASTVLYVIPDGLTVELVDAGFTATETGVAGGTSALIEFGLDGKSSTDDDYFVGGASVTDTLPAGATNSVSRTGSGSWDFAVAPENMKKLGGDAFTVKATKQGSGGGTCKGWVWIRLKYISKDNANI